jgi:hypothetical protein
MVKRLEERADGDHRSLQGELMAISAGGVGASRPFIPDGVLTAVRQLGPSPPREAAAMIRGDRDGR